MSRALIALLIAAGILVSGGVGGTAGFFVASAQGGNGSDGADGAPGADGEDGTDGTDGADGSPGTPGATGATGATGPRGSNGATGATGASGANGTPGANGAPGTPGTPGTPGSNGSNGSNGSDGASAPAFALTSTNGSFTIAGSTQQAGTLSGPVPAGDVLAGFSIEFHTAGPNTVGCALVDSFGGTYLVIPGTATSTTNQTFAMSGIITLPTASALTLRCISATPEAAWNYLDESIYAIAFP